MPNKMLIDAAHPEETRVVVLRGNRVEEFDFESASRKQLRGNIYLAKVTRVEPSLQAAFVDYGGNRHGFLAFSEIHPDYYQIPVADRQALIEAEEREAEEAEARHDRREQSHRSSRGARVSEHASEASEERSESEESVASADDAGAHGDETHAEETSVSETIEASEHTETSSDHEHGEGESRTGAADNDSAAPEAMSESASEAGDAHEHGGDQPHVHAHGEDDSHDDGHVHSDDVVESVGAEDALEEVPERRPRRVRQYKIQEVIKRRQVLLVQVVKEERGNKGAALTTYLSLAGRYCVLMPNTARGGGISRKITSVTDRKRLKQVVSDLEVPQGMGVILRTAGASRTRAEVKRDFEYLLRLWENVRELTLKSSAPTLVYEEGSLIKRSIRDLYNKDIDEVIVAGEDAYREAKDFMRMLMPSHAKNVQPYRDASPLFAKSGIEAQLDAMFSPQVTLRSGGYIVINQTEALVSIDVNSGRSTREHNIEDTALQTNLEAAEEIARQLRLRDLAGLIVIDFIDMEEKRNNRSVERKMKDALKNDRARIQVGRISHFGLLEMSRQRIRTGVLESTTTTCPTCQGTGHVRAPASVALHVLRALEDQLQRGVTHHLTIRTRTVVALYILNQKRQHLAEIEARFGLHVTVAADESITNGAHFAIERGEPVEPRTITQTSVTMASVHVVEDDITDAEETAEATEQDVGDLEAIDGEEHEARESREGGDERGEREGGRRRRRRRGRGRGGEGRQEGGQRHEARGDHDGQPAHRHEPRAPEGDANPEGDDGDEGTYEEGRSLGGADNGLGPDGEPRKRRRGRRGGRRGRRGRGNGNGENRQPGTGGAQQPGEGAYASDEDASDRQPAFPQTYGLLNGDDEIDTTPRIEPAPAREAAPQPAFVRNRFAEPVDEIDTTPLPEPRPAPASASEPRPEPAAEQKPDAEPEPEDPNRPKRSGWWQRRSFFG